jgi:hypothetical protein
MENDALSNPWLDQTCVIHRPRPDAPVVDPDLLNVDVKEERKCLAEIRSKGPGISSQYVLKNGQRAVDFALAYVFRHLKRKK